MTAHNVLHSGSPEMRHKDRSARPSNPVLRRPQPTS